MSIITCLVLRFQILSRLPTRQKQLSFTTPNPKLETRRANQTFVLSFSVFHTLFFLLMLQSAAIVT